MLGFHFSRRRWLTSRWRLRFLTNRRQHTGGFGWSARCFRSSPLSGTDLIRTRLVGVFPSSSDGLFLPQQ
jgi:hypothetical protein